MSTTCCLLPVPLDLRAHFDTVILICIPLIFMGDALHLHFADVRRFGFEIFYLALFAVALSIAAGASLYQLELFAPLSLGGYVALFVISMATDAVSVQSVLSRFGGIGHHRHESLNRCRSVAQRSPRSAHNEKLPA